MENLNSKNINHLHARSSKTYIESYGQYLARTGQNKANNRKRKRYAKMRS